MNTDNIYNGEFITYYENGNPKTTGNYFEGKLNGKVVQYLDAKSKVISFYKDGDCKSEYELFFSYGAVFSYAYFQIKNSQIGYVYDFKRIILL